MAEQSEVSIPMEHAEASTSVKPHDSNASICLSSVLEYINSSSSKKKGEFEGKDFTNLNPQDYGIEFSEETMSYGRFSSKSVHCIVCDDVSFTVHFVFALEPIQSDAGNLPDIYRLMASLEEGENQLAEAKPPPSLYNQPEQVRMTSRFTRSIIVRIQQLYLFSAAVLGESLHEDLGEADRARGRRK